MVIRVLFIAAEAAPFVKVGGLGDVAGSLPQALRALPTDVTGLGGIDVRLVLPFHHEIDRNVFDLHPIVSFRVPRKDDDVPAEVFATELDGLPVYLIDSPIMPKGGGVYAPEAALDSSKFTFFSLAVLGLARKLGWSPDVLHAHDWHTSPAVYALSLVRQRLRFYRHTASLLTVHNLPYLGVGTEEALGVFGLPLVRDSTLPDWANHMLLPLGLFTADHINTVSPGYATEILTPEFGSGLDEFLLTRKDTISGILNGLDVKSWDPATDSHLVTNYTFETLPSRLENKRALQKELDLTPEETLPVLAMITRMDHQKGVDLALEALCQVSDLPWQAVILGTGQPDIEDAAHRLETDFPDRVRARIAFDAPLASRIYGSADAILIPSRYEPCGLTQMIGMRYGCVPIAHATGGLRDTIVDFHQTGDSTGFLFAEATPEDLATTLRRALAVYADNRGWCDLQRRGMRQDFSWERSAKQYFVLYQKLVARETRFL